jgi:predicted acylesterase/phospholipase RssA/CRP-like cAMP-binding protein
MMRTAALLRHIPVFADLSEQHLARLSAQMSEVHVRAGGWIMRRGEAADSMFVVRSGQVEVIDEGPPEALIRVHRRGDVIGELAMLSASTRSASVRARRDAELLELGRAAFEALIEEAPSFALAVTRTLAERLASSRTPAQADTPPRTIAVVELDPGASAAEITDGLARALEPYGSVVTLDGGSLATLEQAEADADRVLLRAGRDADESWTELCVREADLILALTSGAPDSAWRTRAGSLRGCELIVLGPAVPAGLLEELRPREVQVVGERSQRAATVRATARRLAGQSLGVVLSGGGARAMAHLGVLEELQAAGLHFDRVAGASLGALVAAAAARDIGSDAVYEAFERQFGRNPTNDLAPPVFSLIRGVKTRRLLEESFGGIRIEELPLRFFCLSCDLVAREPVVHRSGPIVDAVYASLAIPGVFPPVRTAEGRLLVDGGVLDNLPVATMARRGEGPVIAVDVTGARSEFRRPQRPRLASLGGVVRRALTGREAEIPRLGETIVRTVTVGGVDTVAAARQHADLVITPSIEGVGLLDWGAIGNARELGRRAAAEALAADPDLVRRLSRSARK